VEAVGELLVPEACAIVRHGVS